MSDKNTISTHTPTKTKPISTTRPFYELPEHIKPCSKIIKETQEQLQSKRRSGEWKRGEFGFGVSIGRSGSLQNLETDRPGHNFPISISTGHIGAAAHSQGAASGVKPVHTSRPFTPRDSVNFWGVSSRKRPPSAITLSRLSLDNIDENRSTSSLSFRASISPSSGFGIKEVNTEYNGSEPELEKIRLKLKGLSTGEQGERRTTSLELDDVESRKYPKIDTAKYTSMTIGIEEKINSTLDTLKYYNESPEKVSNENLTTSLKTLKELLNQKKDFTNLKPRIVRTIFKLVEKNPQNEDALFWSSFILLHCQIIGNTLTTIFKIVYKSMRAKDKYADVLYNSEYLDVFMYSLGQICPMTQTESMVYGYGTLRFICTDEPILEKVLNLNIISVMLLHLKILNLESGKVKNATENVQNGVFQLTSVLRSIVGIEGSFVPVGQSGLLNELCTILSWTLEDIDVVSNVVRIFSVVSGNSLCSEILSANKTLPSSVVKILKIWHMKDDIVVRLTYCLGNLLGKNEEMRIKLYNEPLSYQMIVQLICYYMENFNGASEDILVKSIRILANWSLNCEIGSEICEQSQLSELLNSILEAEDISTELLLCTISTLNNISFYKDYRTLSEANLQTAECLYKFLTLKNIDIRTESMKVLGNLTRNEKACDGAIENIGSIMSSLSEKYHEELLCSTIGVLMNIIVVEKARRDFLAKNGFQIVLNLMEEHQDLGLNVMITQLFWNLIISSTEKTQGLTIINEEQKSELMDVLLSKLEETEGFLNTLEEDNENGGGRSFELCTQLLSVAGTLLEKLKQLKCTL